MYNNFARDEVIAEIEEKLRRNFGCGLYECSPERIFKACALVMRDIMTNKLVDTDQRCEQRNLRQVHYLSMEFLLGRSLEKNAFNLGVLETLKDAIISLGYEPADFFEVEPDAALGNGGLGRLAACYLEAMTTAGIPATGYSILYEYGIFKQKIIDGEQQELPDKWLDLDEVWLIRSFDDSRIVRFGGNVEYIWGEHGMTPVYHNAYEVRAVPADMLIAGFHSEEVNRLRLWDSQAVTEVKMNLFSQGEYLKAIEEQSMADVITKLLYPEDNHYEGKMLRLRQQYFLVSASAQDIIAKHLGRYGTLKNLHQYHAIQINDTHPAIIIPELMRIMMDENHMTWDEAWDIVTKTVSYTNHTVMSEALECWPVELVRNLVPRIHDIIMEIDSRYNLLIGKHYGDACNKYNSMSIVRDGQIRMANLCIAACFSVNGVSALHTEILKESVFNDAYKMYPDKFVNVTNGIDHRRWLGQINPGLHDLITELIGDKYLENAQDLQGLMKYTEDSEVQRRLDKIKLYNKRRMASYIQKHMGVQVDPESLFDVQVKRIHEYKRQLLNVLSVIGTYNKILNNPSAVIQPRTVIFGGKAAPGYHMAKRIIQLINSVSDHINSDPLMEGKLNVLFLENYRVSMAEVLMPASELSEQISLAGKEASGTGNMKFMLNGALTIGTMDGANVEMSQQVGRENMFIFGMGAEEVATLSERGYSPISIVSHDPALRAIIDRIRTGFRDGVAYNDIAQSLLLSDTYMLMQDYNSYINTQSKVDETYRNRALWNSMSLKNIAAAGYFAADRSIAEYAKNIWRVERSLY